MSRSSRRRRRATSSCRDAFGRARRRSPRTSSCGTGGGELHRRDDPVDDERRAEAGAESEEEHLAAFVASERLHRRVVDHLRRLAERCLEVEPDPARPEIHRLGHDTTVAHDRRNADRDGVVHPVAGQGGDAVDHLLCGQLGPGRETPRLAAVLRDEHLDVRPTDVEGEDLADHRSKSTLGDGDESRLSHRSNRYREIGGAMSKLRVQTSRCRWTASSPAPTRANSIRSAKSGEELHQWGIPARRVPRGAR